MGTVGDIQALLNKNLCRSWLEAFPEIQGGATRWGNSNWQIFKTCPYKYERQVLKGWQREEPEGALEIGGLFHECLAKYYSSGDTTPADGIKDAHALLDKAEKIVPGTVAQVRRLFTAWLKLRGPETKDCDWAQVGGVEESLEVQEPFPYSAKIDRWILLPDETAEIRECKTAGLRSAELLASYKMDAQFLGQMYLWRRCAATKLTAFNIELITKTQQISITTEGVPIDWRLVKDWEQEMRHLYREYIYCKMAREWPRRRTYNCRRCFLFFHCASGGRDMSGIKKVKVKK